MEPFRVLPDPFELTPPVRRFNYRDRNGTPVYTYTHARIMQRGMFIQ